MSPQVACASALPDKTGKHKNRIFHSNAVLVNSTICLISSIFWLTTHTHAAVWLSKSCNQCVQLGAIGGMVQDKRRRGRFRSWTVLHAQCTSALSSGFHTSKGIADKWGGKTKHRLISYFLRNISAKNYRNRIAYVKIIARQRWEVFWDTV